MFIPCTQGATASTNTVANSCPLPPHGGNSECEIVRHMLFGTAHAVHATILLLHKLNYAEPNDWSQPTPTDRANEVMVILTRRVRLS
ncbi:MAG: hypothetical protein WBD47_08575 [Phormidesmis sp.]